ncbi:rhombosortase [Photobacterium sp. 2_MG-2023]|uniref:rhombosortase n=1 Tax=Photobacterium sp. 2_MG-2023 TaxID=3062663 RepID=UPI0026E46F35|nr:rhombosortase [Photobacterium sp. 2_MG-2023]MDO6579784.1 rhombosortase [Photobacterium sp. 2_MG-2023]
MLSRSLLLSLLATCLFCVAAQLAPLHALLEWQRPLIEAGQWWRILTGNFTHTNWAHLGMNVSGLLIISYLFRFYLTAGRFGLLLASLSLIVGLSLFLTKLDGYAGLSGLLHGVFIWGACQDIRTQRAGGRLLLIAGILKISWDLYSGGSAETASMIKAQIAVEAHLAGAVGGFLLAMLPPAFRLSASPVK